MTSTIYLRAMLCAAALATSAPSLAQNQAAPDEVDATDEADVVEVETPPVVTQRNTVEAEPEPAPAAPPVAQPVQPALEPEVINPYANSYNDLLPIEEEEPQGEAQGFNYWNLLGLLGLLGLFGLRRRDRIVYAERIDPVARRPEL